MSQFSESVVEDAALAWLESLDYAVKHGSDISPGSDTLTLALPRGEGEHFRRVAATRANNATTRLRGNMQKMHIAVSKKATVSKREIVDVCDRRQ